MSITLYVSTAFGQVKNTNPTPAKTPANQKVKSEYFIEDKPVSAQKFNAFLGQLKEVPNTWSCAETTKGGIVTYEVQGKDNTIYYYECENGSGSSKKVIKKKFVPASK